ncbi:MAG: hypothetical protein IJV27_02750 [Prevotella sp.]|nr:hypothetical protein [Prevotella sp.]
MKVNRKTIIILLLLCGVCGVHAQVSVKSEIDSAKIVIGEQAKFYISITADENARIEFPSYKPQQDLTKGIEVVETNGDTLKTSQDKKRIFRRIYTLTAWDEGNYTIPAQEIKVNGKIHTTESHPLEVLTLEADTLHPDEMRPAKDVLDNPFSWGEWIPLILLVLLVVFLLALDFYLIKRLKENKPIMAKIHFVKKLLPHEKALKEIEQMKVEELTRSEDQKFYYTKLTETLRQYLEERFGINAMEMTSGEIIDKLRQEEDKEKIDELRRVFETADLVKFAKYSTQNNENDMYLSHVVDFINATKQEEVAAMEKVTDKLSEADRQDLRSRNLLKTAIGGIVLLVIALLVYVGWQAYELLA